MYQKRIIQSAGEPSSLPISKPKGMYVTFLFYVKTLWSAKYNYIRECLVSSRSVNIFLLYKASIHLSHVCLTKKLQVL